eukprot:5685933-Karenia_brevis.AAC.1
MPSWPSSSSCRHGHPFIPRHHAVVAIVVVTLSWPSIHASSSSCPHGRSSIHLIVVINMITSHEMLPRHLLNTLS